MRRKAEPAIERNLLRSFVAPLGYGSVGARPDQENGANHSVVWPLRWRWPQAAVEASHGRALGVSHCGEEAKNEGREFGSGDFGGIPLSLCSFRMTRSGKGDRGAWADPRDDDWSGLAVAGDADGAWGECEGLLFDA
jgi:hypothetical protein